MEVDTGSAVSMIKWTRKVQHFKILIRKNAFHYDQHGKLNI